MVAYVKHEEGMESFGAIKCSGSLLIQNNSYLEF